MIRAIGNVIRKDLALPPSVTVPLGQMGDGPGNIDNVNRVHKVASVDGKDNGGSVHFEKITAYKSGGYRMGKGREGAECYSDMRTKHF